MSSKSAKLASIRRCLSRFMLNGEALRPVMVNPAARMRLHDRDRKAARDGCSEQRASDQGGIAPLALKDPEFLSQLDRVFIVAAMHDSPIAHMRDDT